jgi:hypothetical protein
MFFATQFLIFLTVKVTLSGWVYNGIDWSWSLAYGSLAILPLVLCRSWSLGFCLLAAVGAWAYGRFVELSPNPSNIELIPYIYIVVSIVCMLSERWAMMIFGVLTALYAVRLTGVEITYWQQGFFNVLAAGLFLTYGNRTPRGTQKIQNSATEEYRRAA